MSKWDEFKTDAGKAVSKVAAKTGEIADAASIRVRIKTLKLRICEEYEKLGRLTYKSVKSGKNPENDSVLAARIAAVDGLNDEIQKLNGEIKAKKDAREAEKKANRSGE